MFRRNLLSLAAVAVLATWQTPIATSLAAENASATNRENAWTLAEAREHLKYAPRDAYVQYVALQLARQEGQLDEVAREISQRLPRRNRWSNRRDQVNLFSLFSGQLAVQESLQLDALAPEPEEPGRPAARNGPRSGPLPLDDRQDDNARRGEIVGVSELQGPEIASHPWVEMLGDRQVQVTGLALKTPADFYFVSFHSVGKLLDATDLANDWGAYAFAQANRSARTQLTTQRLLEQLAVEVKPELRTLYDAAVAEIAIVGSDLFFREGSDVTLLFRVRQPQAFQVVMDRMLVNAQQTRADAVRTTGQFLGVPYTSVATPDRTVQVYSAYPSPELHVRSNSLAGLQRVLAAIQGQDEQGRQVARLGETDEFRYVRSLLPEGAAEEDGFIYLSDPFVRRLMSAEVRLTERRRLLCYNHLRMIGHAALMHRTQTGENAGSLAELAASGCAPGEFGAGAFACPDGGQYELAADGLTGVCTHHGYASQLTPCLEAEAARVTAAEATAYRQFVEEYSRYWRQFFDPIAIRVRLTPEELRAETLVLPLIDNTVYTALSQMLGGEPESLDALPVPESNIVTAAFRINKEGILYQLGLEELLEVDQGQRDEWAAQRDIEKRSDHARNILLSLLNFADSRRTFPAPNENGLSWRVYILPFIGEQALYDRFHLDEAWDSPHNRELIAQIPPSFRPEDRELAAEGRTRFVMSRGPGSLFEHDDRRVKFSTVRDGLSNTVALLEVSDEHAPIWTKPADFALTAADAQHDLALAGSDGFLVGMADGSIRVLSHDISAETLAAMLTRAGGERIDRNDIPTARGNERPRRRLSPDDALLLDRLRIGPLLARGVGNQIALHACDSHPTIDLSLAQFLGGALGSARGSFWLDNDFLVAVPLISAINGPVYASVPVSDPAIVDDCLQRLAGFLAELAAQDEPGGWFPVEYDFYRCDSDRLPEPAWAYGFGVGPVKWRFFWTRIGDGVYVASKQAVLEEIATATQRSSASVANGAKDAGNEPAHALLRLRPEHWGRVLTAYELGWEENQRIACQANLGPLSALQRAVGDHTSSYQGRLQLNQYAARVYDAEFFCPDGGWYRPIDGGRRMECTLHGSADHPRQTLAPATDSELHKQIAQLRDVSVQLTFLEDGLRAVVTLQRQPPEEVVEGHGYAPEP